MKKIAFLLIIIINTSINAQIFTTNTTPVGMEHNVLFNAMTRFKVSQTGSSPLNLNYLFDGKFKPSYTSKGPTVSDPTVILIENLPNSHTQTGAWIGWSTRYWQSNRFKIEAFNVYNSNTWILIADYSTKDYSGGAKFTKRLPSGSFTKIRFTFYNGTGTNGRLGVSELFYIHPEAVSPYEGLILNSNYSNTWKNNNSDIFYNKGNVGIGFEGLLPNAKLRVKMNVPDGVVSKNGIKIDMSTKTATNVTSYDKGLFSSNSYYDIPFNIKDNGYKIGVDASAYSSSIIFKGTLKNSWGIWARAGIHKATPGAKINNAIAVNAEILDNIKGTYIDNAYGVKINTGNYGGTTITNRYDLYAGTPSAKNYFAGNVGIGTITPDAKLTVAGNIHSREVKVTINAGADFVFENDYELPSLESIEHYIKENKHLPEITSAKEMEKEGILLGDMNIKLLQKIEELTLYTIAQEKKINSLENKNKVIKSILKRVLKIETLLESQK